MELDARLDGLVEITGTGDLPSAFAVSDLAANSIAAAAAGIVKLLAAQWNVRRPALVDRRLASMWFGMSIRPQSWALPPPWDPIAGDYRAADGWIRLHTNAPHHRRAALDVLGVECEKAAVAREVSGWKAEALESQIVENGGCAAEMRSVEQWRVHPQGVAVAREPLIDVRQTSAKTLNATTGKFVRPLADVRVLDLTRVLAGPVATRFLAGFGARVLRIDPPDWDEPGVIPEVTLGKRCARLDLRDSSQRAQFERLLAQTDVLVHGYRPDALERLGYGENRRQEIRSGLIDVALDAYGWSGPWQARRGFDSLVQMSSGIAQAGMQRFGRDRPTPLPVQALDHGAGYFMASVVLQGLLRRATTGAGCIARLSLARVASLLVSIPVPKDDCPLAPETADDLSDAVEATPWGAARRLRPPLQIDGVPMRWDLPAAELGSSPPAWP